MMAAIGHCRIGAGQGPPPRAPPLPFGIAGRVVWSAIHLLVVGPSPRRPTEDPADPGPRCSLVEEGSRERGSPRLLVIPW